MEDAFFSQLDGNAVRELLLRTELRHAALFAVSDTLRIERCSDAAQRFPVCTRWRSWIRS